MRGDHAASPRLEVATHSVMPRRRLGFLVGRGILKGIGISKQRIYARHLNNAQMSRTMPPLNMSHYAHLPIVMLFVLFSLNFGLAVLLHCSIFIDFF
jgi:hypothetical protein